MKSRIATYVITFLIILTINFFLPRWLPGDPLSALFDPSTGEFISDDQVRTKLETYYGLNQPMGVQYFSYMQNALTGNLGSSIRLNRPVSELIYNALPWTLLLTLSSLFFSSIIGIYTGMESGWKHHTAFDRGMIAISTLLSNTPLFVIGTLLLFIFGAELRWFPLSGGQTTFASYSSPGAAILDISLHLVLPMTTLTFMMLGSNFLLIRGAMVNTLSEDFMLTARAKGLPDRQQKRHHALRNALLPFIAQIASHAGIAITGAFFIEAIFEYPGMGRLIFNAVTARDYPVIQGVFVIVSFIVLGSNLLADWITFRLDPRTRISEL